MNRDIRTLALLSCLAGLFMAACTEDTGTIYPYHDWENRNQHVIDSIASVAATHTGQWKTLHTYKFDPIIGAPMDNNDYVYAHILQDGAGRACVNATDTVVVHYRGQLIPLADGQKVVFDESFRGTLDIATARPVEFVAGNLITGWTTALTQMHEGDYWTIYVPYTLGYGSEGSTGIPGFSTLIFDIYLEKVKPLKGRE